MEIQAAHTAGAIALPPESLFHSRDFIEFMVPVQLDNRLIFQVFCNGLPIAHARLEAAVTTKPTDSRVVQLFAIRNQTAYVLKMIQVNNQFRNRGIGSMLLQEILHWCRHNRIERLTGELQGDLPMLRRWYANNGFKISADDQIDQSL